VQELHVANITIVPCAYLPYFVLVPLCSILLETNLFHVGVNLLVIYSKCFTFCQESYDTSEAIYNFRQTLIFFMILCYIDSLQRFIASKLDFYGCISFLCMSCVFFGITG
jgi:hypothetical protein